MYEDEVLADNPAIYWRVGAAGSVNGQVADNLQGNSAYDGAIGPGMFFGTPVLVADNLDATMYPDGIDDHVWVEDPRDVVSYTIELWCRPNDVSANRNLVAKQNEIPNDTPSSWSPQLAIVGDPFNTFTHVSVIDNVERRVAGTTIIEAEKRYHVVGTCTYVGYDALGTLVDESTLRIYINGVLQGELVYSGMPFTDVSYWNLAGPSAEGVDVLPPFVGGIGEFAYYEYALSAERILTHYEVGVAVLDDDPVLAGDMGGAIGVPSPLSFSIRPPEGPELDITRVKRDAEWDDNAMGGFGACSFDIPKQLWEDEPRIRRFSDVVISDGEISRYEGRIEDIRRSSSAGGSFMTVEAFGWQRHGRDDMYRGMRSDRRLSRWREDVSPDDALEVIQDVKLKRYESDTLGPVLLASNVADDEPNTGETYVAHEGDRFQVRYQLPDTWRGGIKRLQFKWKASLTSDKRALRVRSYDPNADEYVTHYEQSWTTSEQEVEIDDFADDVRKVWIQMLYMLDDVKEINKASVKVYGPDTRGPVVWSAIDDGRAYKIVREVVKACPRWDATGVQATSFVVEDVDFTNPVYPSDVLDEMVMFAPDSVDDPEWVWQVREKLPNGRYRLLFRPLPDYVSYEVSGGEISGLGDDADNLRNEAILQYVDAEGFEREVVVTQTVDELDAIALTRTISYGQLNIRTESRALRVAAMLLRQHRYPARSGTITVSGEQVRHASSREGVPPWAVRPGYWIRLADLTAPAREPKQTRQENVYLITKVNYSQDGTQAVLTLENSPNRADVLLARLAQR